MSNASCPIGPSGERIEIDTVNLDPEKKVSGYLEAMALAKEIAAERFEEYMLISWYDRDRDYEAPPNTTECPGACEKNGYIFYAHSHGARLKVDIEKGRFIFFFTPVEW